VTSFREYELGQEAIIYLRERLGYGHTLAMAVASKIDLSGGSVRTYVPEPTGGAALADLEHGGLGTPTQTTEWYAGIAHETTEWYVRIAQEFLSGESRRVLVLENNPARASDPCMQSDKSGVVTFGEEVYHVVCAGKSGHDEVLGGIRRAASAWISLGFMTSAPSDWDPASRRFSSRDLTHLAEHTENVAADAYDGESWLIWERRCET
jgi:CelD/BcsL family acetyltransferase involved in cellulose biosynthesis